MCKGIHNPFLDSEDEGWRHNELMKLIEDREIGEFHRSLSGYHKTPLLSLDHLASTLGIRRLLVKDESKRFGLNAFKPLGASYAIFRLIKREWEKKEQIPFQMDFLYNREKLGKIGPFVFSGATDGNHGRAVAWMANRIGQHSKIFMPADTKDARVKNIEAEGAEVVLINGTYDDCVAEVSKRSAENGWIEVADTAYGNYIDIPTWVSAGYSTIFNEIKSELDKNPESTPDIVFLQAGVGAFAAAGAGFFNIHYRGKNIKLVCVEPLEAAGFLDSIQFGGGNAIQAKGRMETIMAGLNCGIPSTVAWPILKKYIDLFLAISDRYAEEAMRAYHQEGIVSGESGASGLAGLLTLLNSDKLIGARQFFAISEKTQVLVINTEGDTDPDNYRRIIAEKPQP